MNNPENIVILPGKSFSKNELIKRLTQMGIEYNVPNGPKVYYDQLYDKSIKSLENQQKIYEKLIWDADFRKNTRRPANGPNPTLRAYGINSEEQNQRANPKTTIINDNLGFNGNLNEDTGRKNFEEIPPNMKSINTTKNKFESSEQQQYQSNKFYSQSNRSIPTSEFSTKQQLKTMLDHKQDNKFEDPYKEQFDNDFNNNHEYNDRIQWKNQIPNKNINITPNNYEDIQQNEEDNFNFENKFTPIPKSNYPLNKRHSSSNITNPFINNNINQDFENDNKYRNLSNPSNINEMRRSNDMRQSLKEQGAFTNPKNNINYTNEQNVDNTSKPENITLSTTMRPNRIDRFNNNINPTREFQNEQRMEEELESDQIYPLEKHPDPSYLNCVYMGGFGILGLFSLVVLFYVIIKREVPSFIAVFNPVMIIRDFLIPSLGRWGRRFFIDYVFVTIAICIVCAVSYFLIKKRNKNNIIKNIFEDIKRTLKEIYEDNNYKPDQEHDEFSGMPENEIIIRYSNYYNISRDVFEREYMPILRDMRRKDENIKLYDDLYQGRKQIFWRWVK